MYRAQSCVGETNQPCALLHSVYCLEIRLTLLNTNKAPLSLFFCLDESSLCISILVNRNIADATKHRFHSIGRSLKLMFVRK